MLIFVLVGCSSEQRSSEAPPNVILIITDDQGYGDLACHGNQHIKTPALDELYEDSYRLTNFHVDPVCSPTRAALLTGHYATRTGVWRTFQGRHFLNRKEVTLAEIFQANNYKTGIFGKWHLGDSYPYRPMDRGFEESIVFGGGGIGQNPDYYGNDYYDDTYSKNGKHEHFNGYCTDVFFDEALDFIEKNKENPFFCMIPTNAPHMWLYVDKEYSEPYEQMGMGPYRARFFGMITNIDYNIGILRSRLKEMNLDENTIVIFMTDNGASHWRANKKDGFEYNAGMRGGKGSQYEGGHRVPFFIHWPEGDLLGGKDINQMTAHFDVLPTLMDLCDLEFSEDLELDGRSMEPLLTGENVNWPERTLFVHRQNHDIPVKWEKCAVLNNEWRLIDGKELYDIDADPGQKHDISEQHPKIVEKLRQEYDSWWQEMSKVFNDRSPNVIGSDYENPLPLTCHDWYQESTLPVWHPSAILNKEFGNAYWEIEVAQAGEYQFVCRELPYEAREDEIDAKQIRLKIGDYNETKDIKRGALDVTFKFDLPEGRTTLQGWFIYPDGHSTGVPFIYAERLTK